MIRLTPFLTQAFFGSKHMKKSEQTNGARRSSKAAKTAAAPDVQLRRQEPGLSVLPHPEPGRRRVVIDLSENAYALLVAMSQHDGDETVEQTVRASLSRDVHAFLTSIDEKQTAELFEVTPDEKAEHEADSSEEAAA